MENPYPSLNFIFAAVLQFSKDPENKEVSALLNKAIKDKSFNSNITILEDIVNSKITPEPLTGSTGEVATSDLEAAFKMKPFEVEEVSELLSSIDEDPYSHLRTTNGEPTDNFNEAFTSVTEIFGDMAEGKIEASDEALGKAFDNLLNQFKEA